MGGSRRGRIPSRRVLVPALAAAVLAAGLVGVAAVAHSAGKGPGSIDGVSVTQAELDFQLGLAAHRGTDEAGARKDAIAAIAHDHAVVELAHRAGVTELTSPAQVLTARDDANRQRQAAVDAGQVVYGKTSYSPQEFYSRTLSQLSTGLRTALVRAGDPRVAVDGAAVRAELTAHPDDWAAGATTYTVSVLTLPGRADANPPASLTALARRVNAAAGAPTGGGDATATPGGIPAQVSAASSGTGTAALAAFTAGAKALGAPAPGTETYEQKRLDAAALSPDTRQELEQTPVGGVSEPFVRRGHWTLLQVTARTTDASAALAAHGEQIRSKLQEAKLEALIENTVSAQENTLR